MTKVKSDEVVLNRRESSDRRGNDRRKADVPVENDRRGPSAERRTKTPRRRQIDPTTCERDYSDQEVEFMNALEQYKRSSGRMFPTCSEILEVIRNLGYIKSAPQPIEAPQDVFTAATVVETPVEPQS